MPIYSYLCDVCKTTEDAIRGFTEAAPVCCGKAMDRTFTTPSLIRICDSGGTRTYSQGYKDGYAKEYRRSIGIDS